MNQKIKQTMTRCQGCTECHVSYFYVCLFRWSDPVILQLAASRSGAETPSGIQGPKISVQKLKWNAKVVCNF